MTRAELSNRISGTKTQLKTHAGGPREPELRYYLEKLLAARDDLPLEERLAELDTRWTRLVDAAAAGLDAGPRSNKLETAKRNAQAGKRRRRGLPPLETVKAETRRHAENAILETIYQHAGQPWADRATAELDEAYDLRGELTRRAEHRAGIAA